MVALAICLLIEQGLLVFYVIYLRTVSATFLNPEDGFGAKRDAKSKSPSKSPRPGSSDRLRNLLERANNAHRNAMENIFVFFTIGMQPFYVLRTLIICANDPIGFLYALTGPSVIVARWLYGVYVASRTIYPILYIKGIQPFRSFAFTIPFAIQVCRLYCKRLSL